MSAMSPRLRVLVAAVPALGLSLSACSSSSTPSGSGGGGSGAHPAPSAVVVLKYVSFAPARVTIHAGQTVEWKWQDAPIAHNVTFRTFASPTEASGTFFHTFDAPGTYSYRCTIHQTMTGEVVVLP